MLCGVPIGVWSLLVGGLEPVRVSGGVYTPFYPPSPTTRTVSVAPFRMDATPVTVASFAAFVQQEPKWTKGHPAKLFADEGYLRSWDGPAAPPGSPERPVTSVSWFAARAYCQSKGGDLPTVDQWEYAADATGSATSGARSDPNTLDQMLRWYSEGPGEPARAVAQGTPNFWGLYDVYGLIWEWTLDFNSLLLSADTRDGGDGDIARFCGAGAVSATDVEDYASFMRFAMRSSLAPSYTTPNLGFRCAYSL